MPYMNFLDMMNFSFNKTTKNIYHKSITFTDIIKICYFLIT